MSADTATSAARVLPHTEGSALQRLLRGALTPGGAVFLLVAVLFVAVVWINPSFGEPPQLIRFIGRTAPIAIAAMGQYYVIVSGEFDLSMGAVIATQVVIAGNYIGDDESRVLPALVLMFAVGAVVGLVNGLGTTLLRVPSFIVTLGTFFVLQGVNLAVTRIVTGGVSSNTLTDMDGWASAQAVFASSFDIGPVSIKIPVLYWILLTALLSWLLLRTRVGNWIFAVGGDSAAARAVGVPVVATKVGLFMGVGFGAWLLGMHMLFEYNNVQSGQGVGNEFIYIIAAVIGGCLLTGGYGSILGAAIGALIYGKTQLGISYAGWDVDWLKTFLGIMLIGATLVNMYVKKKADAR